MNAKCLPDLKIWRVYNENSVNCIKFLLFFTDLSFLLNHYYMQSIAWFAFQMPNTLFNMTRSTLKFTRNHISTNRYINLHAIYFNFETDTCNELLQRVMFLQAVSMLYCWYVMLICDGSILYIDNYIRNLHPKGRTLPPYLTPGCMTR